MTRPSSRNMKPRPRRLRLSPASLSHFLKRSLLLVAWIGVAAAGCSPQDGDSRDAGDSLVIGMELAYPPFETRAPNGDPAGVSVDLANALGAALERPIRIENMRFDGLIPALQTGSIDLIISSMTATDERRKSIAFSDPYAQTGLCLLVGADTNIQSIDDLKSAGARVAVKRGTTGHVYANAHLTNATVRVLDKEDAGVLEVVQNKSDAFIYDQLSIYKHWSRNRDQTRAILAPFQAEQWAIGLRKDASELRDQINAFLKSFKESGGFDRLAEKRLGTEKKEFERLGFPFLF